MLFQVLVCCATEAVYRDDIALAPGEHVASSNLEAQSCVGTQHLADESARTPATFQITETKYLDLYGSGGGILHLRRPPPVAVHAHSCAAKIYKCGFCSGAKVVS